MFDWSDLLQKIMGNKLGKLISKICEKKDNTHKVRLFIFKHEKNSHFFSLKKWFLHFYNCLLFSIY